MWLAERRIDAIGAAELFQATAPHTDLFVSAVPSPHGVAPRHGERESGRQADAPDTLERRHRLRVVSRVLMATLIAVWSVVFYAYGR